MEAELVLKLSDEDWDSVEALIQGCNAADGSSYSTEPDGDFFYLVRNTEPEESGIEGALLAVLFGYRLGDTEDGQEVLEICAYTAPAARRLGCFTLCLHALQDDFRNFRFRFLVKPAVSDTDDASCADRTEDTAAEKSDPAPESAAETEDIFHGIPEDTRETLMALGAVHLYDELFLMKTLPRGISDPGDSLCSRFGEVYFSRFNEDTLYLYGLLVYERFQRQGHGRAMLEKLETQPAGPYRHILLQVSSRNVPALRLYLGAGYRSREALSYWTL